MVLQVIGGIAAMRESRRKCYYLNTPLESSEPLTKAPRGNLFFVPFFEQNRKLVFPLQNSDLFFIFCELLKSTSNKLLNKKKKPSRYVNFISSYEFLNFYAVFRNSKFFWKITNMNRSSQEDAVFCKRTHFPNPFRKKMETREFCNTDWLEIALPLQWYSYCKSHYVSSTINEGTLPM